jgi:hypothetical protein
MKLSPLLLGDSKCLSPASGRAWFSFGFELRFSMLGLYRCTPRPDSGDRTREWRRGLGDLATKEVWEASNHELFGQLDTTLLRPVGHMIVGISSS